MFKKNDYVMYESAGVCQVKNVDCPDFAKAQNRQYYFLKPLHSPCDCIYVPLDSTAGTKMRRILTKREAKELIGRIPSINCAGMSEDESREVTYKKALHSFDCYEWVKMIKDLYIRIDERRQNGKKPIQMDEKYMDAAEAYLHGELSVALGIPIDSVKEFIDEKVKEVM